MTSPVVYTTQKPHVVCVPHPAQGHINLMLKVSKLLHAVTFVNTVYNHKRLLRSRRRNALDGFPSFRFESIPDGLPETDGNTTQDIPSLCVSTMNNCLSSFKDLLRKINIRDDYFRTYNDVPPVSCIVSDAVMSFTLDAAEEQGVPDVVFWTTSACGLMAFLHFQLFIEKGLTPFKDTVIDWIQSMKIFRLKDFPSFIRTTDPDDIMLNFSIREVERFKGATAIILNTFDDLEHDVIQSIKSMLPLVYSIGPLNLLASQEFYVDSDMRQIGLNLRREETECLDWLDTKAPNSVVFVNFGCITMMSVEQLDEFAWGLVGSGKEFWWVIRPDLVAGEGAAVPPEFIRDTVDRGMMASWCPQEKVIYHPAIGGFLTHCGWNSTLESLCDGVPMICWPFFAEQPTNCKFCCDEWGVGMEIGGDVKREEVEAVI
ncbi:unnamed protein product [Brassica oleracea]